MLLEVKEKPRIRAKKNLRTGYTTGACAAAAAKAAAKALLTGQPVGSVEIVLPIGRQALFSIHRCQLQERAATCSVIKDAGDDPDVTHGAEICATVSWRKEPSIQVEGGEGVGQVTRPGLGLEVGGPAINPVPRKMITESVAEALGRELERRGVRVLISAPRGQELARRTLNPRLGIIGGISILGTTGVVIPYSTAAFRACILQSIDVARASGLTHLVLTTGGRSEAFAQRLLPLPQAAFIQMGDWVGFALKACARKGVARVTLCGMMGKLSKIASGHFQTHASRFRTDTAFLASLASSYGAEIIDRLRQANSVRHVYEIISQSGHPELFHEVCRLACLRSRNLVGSALAIECLMTDYEGKELVGRASLDDKANGS